MKNIKKLPVYASALCAVAVLYGVVKHFNQEHEEHEALTYLAVKPWHQTLDVRNEYVAQIRSMQHIEFRSFEKGYLQKIFVDEGQRVEKDQEIFQIMPQLLQAEYEKANAEFHLAQIEFSNTESLNKNKVVSANELALAKARMDKAAAELKLAETHLALSTIKAPFSGIIDRFHARIGSLVEEGELLTTLSDNSTMWVYFNVSEADYLNYTKRKQKESHIPVSLKLANGDTFAQEGQIDTIEADFNNETGNVAFRASFANPEGELRHGQTGTVVITEKLADALVIPQKATFEILDKKYVYVVDDKNTLHAREVKVAKEVPHLFAVASGLGDGDTVLLEGLGKVRDGQEVKVNVLSTKDVLSGLNLPVE